MATLVHRSDWGAPLEEFDIPSRSHESQLELDDRTDRQFHFPSWYHTLHGLKKAPSTPVVRDDSARSQWLKEHDIRTQFMDAGIGCCWFAQQGDQEPVSGETEDEAIARLAQENGLPWAPPAITPAAESAPR